mmetsp:Transcript_20918/g.55389  ORF Transcript_20918/g.55389 Transcript_20918/m.55389 type:complete len:224 (+) Transcript_20918:98-769(+)
MHPEIPGCIVLELCPGGCNRMPSSFAGPPRGRGTDVSTCARRRTHSVRAAHVRRRPRRKEGLTAYNMSARRSISCASGARAQSVGRGRPGSEPRGFSSTSNMDQEQSGCECEDLWGSCTSSGALRYWPSRSHGTKTRTAAKAARQRPDAAAAACITGKPLRDSCLVCGSHLPMMGMRWFVTSTKPLVDLMSVLIAKEAAAGLLMGTMCPAPSTWIHVRPAALL